MLKRGAIYFHPSRWIFGFKFLNYNKDKAPVKIVQSICNKITRKVKKALTQDRQILRQCFFRFCCFAKFPVYGLAVFFMKTPAARIGHHRVWRIGIGVLAVNDDAAQRIRT